jgi:hypothetical protein
MDQFRERIISSLSNEIQSRNVVIHSPDSSFYEQLKLAFPVNHWGIDWNHVPHEHFDFSEQHQLTDEYYLVIQSHLNSMLDRLTVPDTESVILLSTALDFGIEIRVGILRLCLEGFLSLPLNLIIFPQDISWCWCHTSLYQVYFCLQQKEPLLEKWTS